MKKVASAIIISAFSAVFLLVFAFAAQGGDSAKKGMNPGKAGEQMPSMHAQSKKMENVGEDARERALDEAEQKREEKLKDAERKRKKTKEAVSAEAEEKSRIKEHHGKAKEEMGKGKGHGKPDMQEKWEEQHQKGKGMKKGHEHMMEGGGGN